MDLISWHRDSTHEQRREASVTDVCSPWRGTILRSQTTRIHLTVSFICVKVYFAGNKYKIGSQDPGILAKTDMLPFNFVHIKPCLVCHPSIRDISNDPSTRDITLLVYLDLCLLTTQVSWNMFRLPMFRLQMFHQQMFHQQMFCLPMFRLQMYCTHAMITSRWVSNRVLDCCGIQLKISILMIRLLNI